MAVGKEIRTKIASVKNTQKITGAMEMVAASKMRKAQDRMLAAKPYASKIRNVVAHLALANPEYHHPFLTIRDVKRIGIVVVSSDRGLCGGLNANLFRSTLRFMKEQSDKGVEIDLVTIGSKATAFFGRSGGEIVSSATHLGDTPSISSLIGTIKVALDSFVEGNIDELYLINNKFINSMTQSPEIEAILPLQPSEEEHLKQNHWDYIYEPEAKAVIDPLLTRYIEALVYEGVIENIACEQSARMVAMKSASDNAATLIDDLELIYNKARQAAITQELSEIVAGAAAV